MDMRDIKMNRFVSIILFCLGLLWAQSISELEDKLPSEQNEKRLEMLQQIASSYSKKNPKKSRTYYQEALKTAKILNKEHIEAKILGELGIIEINSFGNYQTALDNFLTSLNIVEQLQDKKSISTTLCNVGIAYEMLGKYDDAISYNKKSLEVSKTLGDKYAMALAENNLGNAYTRKADYSNALKSYLHALQLKEEIGEKKTIPIVLNNIGMVYEKLGNFTQALEYHHKTLEMKKKYHASDKSLASSYINIANIHFNQKSYEKALESYQLALLLKEKTNDKKGMAISLKNIGAVFYSQKKYEEAISYYQQALAIERNLDYKLGIASSLISIAKTEQQLGNDPKVLKLYKEAEKYATEIAAKDVLQEIYKNLNLIYKQKNDYETALIYHEKMVNVKDQIFNVEQSKQLAEMTTKFDSKAKDEKITTLQKSTKKLTQEKAVKDKQLKKAHKETEEKNKQIQLLEKEKEITSLQMRNTQLQLDNKELELNRVTNQRLYFIIVSALSFLLAFTIFNQYRVKKRDVKNLAEANKQIREQKRELEKLFEKQTKLVQELRDLNATKNKFFSIIAHDLKNGFSSLLSGSKLLTIHINDMDKESIQEIAEELKNSTDTLFNLLQNLLQWSRVQTGRIKNEPEELPIYMLLHHNIRLLKKVAEDKQINLHAEVDENLYAKADKNMINSVIQNLTYNALKFTQPNGEIKLTARTMNQNIQISIIDNGVGMTEKTKHKIFRMDEHVTHKGTNDEQGTGLGLLLCKEFVEKNNGKIWVDSEVGKGTSVHFTIPRQTELVE